MPTEQPAEAFCKPFDRLNEAEIERLGAFPRREGVLVVGLDRGEWPPFRGGCTAYVVASAVVFLFFLGPEIGLSATMARGLATAGAIWVTGTLLRTFRAVKRSRALLRNDEGWYALAWSEDVLCYRSFDLCLLLSWAEVAKIEYLGEDVAGGLADTLWITTVSKERVLVETREGRFAGRRPSEWSADLRHQWEKATGRAPPD